MSEYWVSKKKYYCKYCEIYIADDAPSRQQHENGLRHKGNKERFVRGLYKASEKKKHDLEEEKREMARVEQVRLPVLLSQARRLTQLPWLGGAGRVRTGCWCRSGDSWA
jgi:ribosomal protein L15E